ncbi:protein NDUFAF4 homolog [Sitophilus oryzae]|uniref:Protein NDUFAF4 homolog n=1 Tax=Sitophilus oryzae TaxID=7048 RepID=A0A6J2XNM1_SITOR|nr:protein NDUFAF4 homolog [Sitophilus oryzae]
MGKVLSSIKHPFRNFNLEDRAHKIIGQSKPIPAPRHAKDEIDIQRLKEDYSEAFEESLKKNEQLDKHLKDVYVVSNDRVHDWKIKENPDRPLPKDRTQSGPFLFGHKDPDRVPIGKVILKDALTFISQHQNDPKTHSPSKIAEDYKLSKETVENVLKYYRIFEIYLPDKKTNAKFAGPSIPESYKLTSLERFLPPPVKNKKDES